MNIRAKQQGFTLIELIIVIIVLGILSAFAFSKYQSMQTYARIGVLTGVRTALDSATRVANLPGGTPLTLGTACAAIDYGGGLTCASGVVTIVANCTATWADPSSTVVTTGC